MKNMNLNSTLVKSLLNGGAEDSGEKVEVLLHGEVLIERKASRHIPHDVSDIPHLADGVESLYHRLSRFGAKECA